MASFDFAKAKAAGYSDDEIKSFLLSQKGVEEAKAAGYSDDEILSHFGFGALPQMEGLLREPALMGSAALKGAAATLGLPGTVAAKIDSMLPDWLAGPIHAAIASNPLTAGLQHIPTVEQTTGFTKSLGLTDRADLIPQNEGEKYASAISEGVGSSVPLLATGGAAIPLLAAGAGGGAGAQAASDLMPGSDVAPIVGGLLGGLGIQGITSAAERGLAARAAKSELTGAESGLAKLTASGMPERVAAQESLLANQTDLRNQLLATKNSAQSAHDAAHVAADNQIGQVASSLGTSETLQDAGMALQSSARDWIGKTLPKKLSSIWEPVDKAIPGDTSVPLASFKNALDSITTSAGELEPLAAKLKPSLPAALKDTLSKVSEKMDLTGASPSWSDVQKLRTTLGDAMSNPSVIKDVGEQNLSQLYATLTADMKSAARSVGPDVEKLFNSANDASRQLYNVAEGTIGKIISGARASADDPTPENVAKMLLAGGKSGASHLAVLRAEMPKAVDELAAAHLKLSSHGWGGLSPEAKNALVPDAASRLTLDSSLAGKTAAKESLSSTLENARQFHNDSLASIKSIHREQTLARQQALLEAKTRLAKAKKAAKIEGPGAIRTGVEGVFGLGTGQSLGLMTLNALGLPGSELTHGAVGAVVGALAPTAVRAAAQAIRQPKVLLGPAVGASAGNALSLD